MEVQKIRVRRATVIIISEYYLKNFNYRFKNRNYKDIINLILVKLFK